MRIKFKLYTDEHGEPQVLIGNPDMLTVQKYWREDGKLSFLSVMADDPANALEQVAEGVYSFPKL